MQFESIRTSRITSRPSIAAAVAALAASAPVLADCGVAGSGYCVIPHETVGCSDSACCTLVCNADPFCCDVGWDEYCAAAAVNDCGLPPSRLVIMTFGAITTMPNGLIVSPCDLVAYDVTTQAWTTWFDGNDVGLASRIIRSATVLPNGDLLVSMDASSTLPGLAGGPNGTAYEPFDILRFTPTTLGDTTAGSWAFHFDGSDVGLTGNPDMAIRALSVLADGSLVINTKGDVTLPGVGAVTATDLVKFTPTSLGSVTAGTWSMYMDGSDVGLSSSNERLDSAFVRTDGTCMLSTRGVFAVTGLSGGRADLIDFEPLTTGENTTGSFQLSLSGVQMALASTVNPQACFEDAFEYPTGPRPGSGGGGGGSTGPTSCGDTGTADCCVTSATPYCADVSCCESVCDVDPLCCAIAWDEYCVGHATELCEPCMAPARAVMTFGGLTTLPSGLIVGPCDLASYDLTTGEWATWFDGNDVGLATRIIRSATVLPNGDVLISIDSNGTLAGLAGGPNGTAYEPYDLLRFTPTSLGETTAGSWSFHFDGSDVGLVGNADMALRGVSVLEDGSLVMSLRGNVSLPGLGDVTANDVVKFTPTSLGAATAGTWSMYFDGSDVGLSTTNERLDGVYVNSDGRIIVSTRGVFDVPGVSGTRGDLLDFIPTTIGDTTSGTFAMRLTYTQMGLPSTLNPQATFFSAPIIEMESRPMLPVLFDRLPHPTVSANAVDAGHAEYLIVYQGVDPNAASTGLIDTAAVIAAIRAEYGDNPSGYGILDFENPFIDRLEAGPSDPNWQMTADTVVAALQAVKAEFPQVKWTMYSMPLIRYWLPPYYSWADATPAVREEAFTKALVGFDPVLRECDWFNPSAYDRYELATYSAAQQASKTAQEIAWREALVEVCNRFNAASGLPRKPIIPMVSPMFWRVGQISYNMKQMPLEELLRDSIQPLMNEGADGVAFWTGLSYWVRAATSAQNLGSGQEDSRYAFTLDFLGGVAPADWTAAAVRDDLELRISQHISTKLNEVRLEIYNLLFGEVTPPG